MSIEQPSPTETNSASRWPPAEVWLLGALGLFGLIGFIVAFGLVMMRTAPDPQAAMPKADAPAGVQQPVTGPQALPQKGPQGDPGPPGPPGPRGATGDAGIRIVRSTCNTGDCTLQCEPNEVLLTAHCGVGRTPAIYPTEASALCRSRSTARVEVVAACVKSRR
jgi:hypothetical protein